MPTSHFTVIALPHSLATDAGHHVSLFISPDLVPDGSQGRLRRFRHFSRWAKVLRVASEFELFDQQGPIDAKPVLEPISSEEWQAIFPPNTLVRGLRPPEFANRHWRTFAAAELHDAGKVLHMAAMFADPISPPLPSRHPLSGMMARLGVKDSRRSPYNEKDFTRAYDREIGELKGNDAISLSLLERNIAAEDNSLKKLALQLHRARRFYERPESARAYRERPIDGATTERPPRPEPDFHERCALLADHPSLQRRLGLVVDLVIQDPARLEKSRWLSARIVPRGDTGACRTTRTRCESVGSDLVTVAGTEDWSQARLRLGDASHFALLDVDPDGTALKLDRYLWSVPRMMAVERNGDPIHAAPTALRSIGFTVARHLKALGTQDRFKRQAVLQTALDQGSSPLLDTEDVTQGLRVEVWDDTERQWFTLHARRITAEALGHGTVVDDLPEIGFIQGTTATETPGVDDSPVHVHESVFGWEGWSLSAARPGKRIRHEEGAEIVEEPDANPDPTTPLIVTNRVEPGTLPRLRYGRSYAFRAWAVDLAGNSRAHGLDSAGGPGSTAVRAVARALKSRLRPVVADQRLAETFRAQIVATATRRDLDSTAGGSMAGAGGYEAEREAEAGEFRLFADSEIDRLVLARLRRRRAPGRTEPLGPISADRKSLVGRAFTDAVVAEGGTLIATTESSDVAAITASILDHLDPDLRNLPQVLDTVTPLRPFLRWDPVQPPAIVSRHAYSSGESLHQLVIRSGVTQDLETLDITVTPPAEYAVEQAALDYRATSERHLAPPKTSQSESELHGAFDEAIGSTDPAVHRKMLAVAVREIGNLFDIDVPRLDDPSIRDPQPGIQLVTNPGVQHAEPMQLPLAPEEMPAPGQYVIHDTDQLVLPYLPDVLGRGISLVFPEAGRDRQIPFPFGVEGFTARYGGDWPERRPFRLVVEGSTQLTGDLDGTVLRLGLPPGDVQRFRLASSLDRDDLDLFGLWRSLPRPVRTNPDVLEAAADGWLWSLTPFDDVTLVHAVPRPLEAPRPTLLKSWRAGEGATDVALTGAVDVHGPSTEAITAEARWVDPVDDLSLPEWEKRAQKALAFTTTIREEEDLAVLHKGVQDFQLPIPGFGAVWLHSAIHRLGDTRHHTIHYRFRAATRFREYFDAAALAPAPVSPPPPGQPVAPGTPVDDGQSVVGPEVTVSVLSSAKPAAPMVHSVLPLFRWDEGTEPEQPVAVRRRRRAGIRIYLERPWFSSGEGELLGVLLAPGAQDAGLEGVVSQWGADPVWLGAPVHRRAMSIQLGNLLQAAGLDDRPNDAQPVVPPETLPLPLPRSKGGGERRAVVLGYRPQFSVERQKWYADVAIDPRDTFWPFVRLAVARYQPESISGCHLSAPILCDYVQLTPERTTSVSRTDIRHVRVVVSGPVGVRNVPRSGLDLTGGAGRTQPPFPTAIPDLAAKVAANRKVVARLQRRDPAIPTDLGWETVAAIELTVRGHGKTGFEAAWVGELEAPEDLPLRRPGKSPNWRVTIEEWERLPGDPANLGFLTSIGFRSPPPIWEQRLIYAEEVAL